MPASPYGFGTQWSSYAPRDFGRAFLSHNHVQRWNHVHLFDDAGWYKQAIFTPDQQPAYYPGGTLQFTVFTFTNPDNMKDAYAKLNPAKGDIAVLLCIHNNEGMIKIKLGPDLIAHSRLATSQAMLSYVLYKKTATILNATLSPWGLLQLLANGKPLFPDIDFLTMSMPIALMDLYFEDIQGNIITADNKKRIVLGEKVRIKAIAETFPKVTSGTKATIQLFNVTQGKAVTPETSYTWEVTFVNNEANTPYFQLPFEWLDENKLTYKYDNIQLYEETNKKEKKRTETTNYPFQTYKAVFTHKTEKSIETKSTHYLTPISYLRNYEEYLGAQYASKKTEDKKPPVHLASNSWENYFTCLQPEMAGLCNHFINQLLQLNNADKANLTQQQSDIINLIKKESPKFWNAAIRAFLPPHDIIPADDRPLYWARLKAEVWIKRMPAFKDDWDMEHSLVKPGTKLAEAIRLFEEGSRNYNATFSEGKSTRPKIALFGFDPFLLNSITPMPTFNLSDRCNILQSNPSAYAVLYMAANYSHIENLACMLFPVRYTDFDNSTIRYKSDPNEARTGVVEKYVTPLFKEANYIVSMSQASKVDDYNLDVFATLNRGGLNDNMNHTRVMESDIFAYPGPVTAYTLANTLPLRPSNIIANTIPPDYLAKVRYYRLYSKTYADFKSQIKQTATPANFPQTRVFDGPGGCYLSNEIFYRIAAIREEHNRTAGKPVKTGHFHLPKTQHGVNDVDKKSLTNMADIVSQYLTIGLT